MHCVVSRRGPGREEVVRARLSGLLSRLGTLPLAGDEEDDLQRCGVGDMPADLGVGRLLDVFCPKGVVVVRDSWPAPAEALEPPSPVHHLVVAPRGAVVVGSCGPRPEERSPAVRAALSRAGVLRKSLGATAWCATPVFAAVCVVPAPPLPGAPHQGPAVARPVRPRPRPAAPLAGWLSERAPVVIGELWVGCPGRLPAWLASGNALGPDDRGALCSHLAGSLAGTSP